MTSYDLANEQDREDRRKHLELVSAIINRMAGASATAKGWAITIAGAAFGVAVVRDNWHLYLLGVAGLTVFGVIDGLYLYTEKRFRDLYDAVVQNRVEPLSLSTVGLDVRPRNKTYLSWSVCGFYAPLIIVGLVLMFAALLDGGPTSEKTPKAGASQQRVRP